MLTNTQSAVLQVVIVAAFLMYFWTDIVVESTNFAACAQQAGVMDFWKCSWLYEALK